MIKLYQSHISPHKGFSCAYRIHTGRPSCSQLGYRAIRYFGVWRGLFILRQRLNKCGLAHRRYSKVFHKQAGFVDFSCDVPCDAPSCDYHDCHANQVCDIFSNYSNCGDRKSKKHNDEEQYIYIPPNVKK